MEKYGNPLHEFRGIPLSGYKKNLKGIAPEEIQSTYSVRAEDGKVFFNSIPTRDNYLAAEEIYSPIDDSRYGHDQAAEAVRGQAVRAQMFDTYRRTAQGRGGGHSDSLQINEEMVSKDEEGQTMATLYSRGPDQKALNRRQAVRMYGKCETSNEFDFEHLHNGGLHRQHRDAAYAADEAKRLQDKKHLDRIKTEVEWNAQDYFSRQDLKVANDVRNENPQFVEAWKVHQNWDEARPNYAKAIDPVHLELIQSLKAAQIMSSTGQKFRPDRLLAKMAENGATQAELTDLTEVLVSHFGPGSLNKACSAREFLHLVGEAVEQVAAGAPVGHLSRDERAMWSEVSILAKTTQLLLAPAPKATAGGMPNITRIAEKYSKREGYLTQQLDNGEISRAQYHAELYKTMTKFHDSLMEVANRHIASGAPDEKLVALIDNTSKIFELWAAGAGGKPGVPVALAYKEVDAIKNVIAFNAELLGEHGLRNPRSVAAVGGTTELYLKAYAALVENVMRFSSTFDKENPGVRVRYKQEYTKISEALDRVAIRAAPKALRESCKVLGAKYQEILDSPTIPHHAKVEMLTAIDMSISKADAMLKNASRVVDPRVAEEIQNAANASAVLAQEISGVVSSLQGLNPTREARESYLGKHAELAYQNHQMGPRTERANLIENRGEFSQQRATGELRAGGTRATTRDTGVGAHGSTFQELRVSEGNSGRSEAFTPGSIADTIANSSYSSAYGGASEFPTEISYQHRW